MTRCLGLDLHRDPTSSSIPLMLNPRFAAGDMVLSEPSRRQRKSSRSTSPRPFCCRTYRDFRTVCPFHRGFYDMKAHSAYGSFPAGACGTFLRSVCWKVVVTLPAPATVSVAGDAFRGPFPFPPAPGMPGRSWRSGVRARRREPFPPPRGGGVSPIRCW